MNFRCSPRLRGGFLFVDAHVALGIRELTESEPISEERLFPGRTFHLSLTALFDDDPER